jgi:putative RecB family exonuclease
LAESLLITGPPASGKSRIALNHFLAEPNALLLTPTATMAEHIRNELARALVPVRPSRVITLAQFLDRVGAPKAVSKATLHGMVERALDQLQIPHFRAVTEFRGFRNAIAALLEEVETSALPGDLARVSDEVKKALAARSVALRNARLRAVAESTCELPPLIVVDGFFTLSNAELALIESLVARTRFVVTMPDWPGTASARNRLLAAGFSELRMERAHRTPALEAFAAPTLEQEAEEIARRILVEVAKGRAFREIGIVLRVREPYAAALATTLARFGIPARFYFADSLGTHPAVAFLAGIVRAMLGGWRHDALLTLFRMPISGIGATPEGDRFDFEFREMLPGRGIPLRARLREIPPKLEALLDAFSAMHPWLQDRVDPAEWAARLKTLRALIPSPVLSEDVTPQQLQGWSSTAAALDAFDAVLDEAATGFASDGEIALAEFWRQIETALELTDIRAHDRRRDVVHVLDVFEARQWELPAVFVCGMVERHFPQYHREDALLDDASRRRAGIETSIDLQREERSLFQLATLRATEQTILSYSRYDERGEATLPSFFLAGMNVGSCELRIRPRPTRSVAAVGSASLHDSALLRSLAGVHRTLSPSSIERFLQCPFQFFAERTLKLHLRPPAPRDRLTVLVQGNLIHDAIAALEEMPLLGATILDQVITPVAKRLRIPGGYRAEAVRLEMLRNLTAFLAAGSASPDRRRWPARVEQKFNLELTPELTVRGRIDRLEMGPDGEALVIDYKYSAANKIKERVKDQDRGDVVQAGLYLLAAVKQFQLMPAGMLYCGLRKDVEWGGWHLPIAGLEKIGESCTPARLEELTRAAEAKALEVFASITSGDIAVRPADEKKCDWCDYRDICRVETR